MVLISSFAQVNLVFLVLYPCSWLTLRSVEYIQGGLFSLGLTPRSDPSVCCLPVLKTLVLF